MSLRFFKAMNITLSIAGIPINVTMTYGDYLPLYEKYITEEKTSISVFVPENTVEKARVIYPEYCTDAYVEHMELCTLLSDALLCRDRVFFHGTAFMWKGKAWILTAPSGTGKTTQYARWRLMYGDAVQLINGDKPVLEFGDETVTVHHSPWRGKENMGQQLSGELGGIIVLEQAKENRIEPMGKNAIVPIFSQFIYTVTCDSVSKVCELEDRLLRRVPVFKLYNCGDEASTRLTHDCLEEVLK